MAVRRGKSVCKYCFLAVEKKNINRHQKSSTCRVIRKVLERGESLSNNQPVNINTDEAVSDNPVLNEQHEYVEANDTFSEDEMPLNDESYSESEQEVFDYVNHHEEGPSLPNLEDHNDKFSRSNLWHPFKNRIEAVIYTVMFCQRRPSSFESMKRWWVVFKVLEIEGKNLHLLLIMIDLNFFSSSIQLFLVTT
jgi:hypothetical protein